MNRQTLEFLTHKDAVLLRLNDAGMSRVAADQKAAMFGQVARALIQADNPGDSPACAWFVPGRIEVFGKHTDYAGGRSLTAAVERGFCAVAIPRDDSMVSIIELAGGQSIEFPLSVDLMPTSGHWSNYPMTVTRRLARNFGEFRSSEQEAGNRSHLRGASIAFLSDLPLASGMSSSSALVITLLLLMRDINHLEEHPAYIRSIHSDLDLAGYAASIENGQSFAELEGDQGVGTFGGSEDHTAILNASPGEMGQYSYCPVKKERSIKLPSEYVFAIASSGVVAEKTGSAMVKYNWAAQSAAAVAQVWRDATGRDDPHIASVVVSAGGACDRNVPDVIRRMLIEQPHPNFSSDNLIERWEHFFAESEQIIPSIADAIDGSGLIPLGELSRRSQHLAETLLGNQVPETVFLARSARDQGASAASAFGAGFGGSVWALVRQEQSREFLKEWSKQYREAYPDRSQAASFFTTGAGPSAFAVTASFTSR